jgi:hypothetical protein
VTLSTGALRTAWAPACAKKAGDPYGAAYGALDAWLRHHQYAPRKADTGAYNCRKITGGSGYSLHSYGPAKPFAFWSGVEIATSLAVDINWQSNPYGPRLVTDMPRAMVDAIEDVRTNDGQQVWRWGGYYAGNKDAMHYEIVCSPASLKTGINPATLPQAAPTPEPQPAPGEDDDEVQQSIVWIKDARPAPKGVAGSHAYLVTNNIGKWLPTFDAINLSIFLGVKVSAPAEKPLDGTFRDCVALVDGPLRNVPS